MAKFGFNPKTQRFHYLEGKKKGSFVSQDEVKKYVDVDYIQGHKPSLEKLGKKLIRDAIDITDWEQEKRKLIKQLHINAYTLGKGGLEQMTPRDWGIIGNRVRMEYTYLRNFTNKLLQDGMSEAQFLYRTKMYADAGFFSYMKGRDEGHRNNQYFWQKDNLNAQESCGQCLAIAAKGWVEIGSTTPIGLRECKVNCRCDREYSQSINKPENKGMTALTEKISKALNVIEAAVAMERPLSLPEIRQTDLAHVLLTCGELAQTQGVDLSDRLPGQEIAPTIETALEPGQDITPVPKYVNEGLSVQGIVVKGMEPTKAQLKKINQYLPHGAAELTEADVITVPIAASNNLLQWSNEVWHPRSLAGMAKKLRGRNFLRDHGDDKGGVWGMPWDSIKTHLGVIYDTRYESASVAPAQVLNTANHRKINERIVQDMGYHHVTLDVFFPRESQIAQALAYGLVLDVSTGTMGEMKFYCPECSDFLNKKNVEYSDKDCPHLPPTRDILWKAKHGYLEDEDLDRITDYYVEDGVTYGVETSFVIMGNLPNARVVRNFDVEEGIYAQ